MESGAVSISIERPDTPDARRCLEMYAAELAERFEEGFDPTRGSTVAKEDMEPPGGYLLLARVDGEAVGCGVLKRLGGDIGEIKRLWVHPRMRGRGLAARLMQELEALASSLGWSKVRLDTNRTLTEAQTLYERLGYRDIPRYNDNPYAHRWFEKDLGRSSRTFREMSGSGRGP
jgi:GNAT superfamily N-acetyltransferase